MNPDPALSPDDPQARLRAEAINDARHHVEEHDRQQRELAQAALQARHQTPSQVGRFLYRELSFNSLRFAPLLFFGLTFATVLAASIVWLLESLRFPFYFLVRALDVLTGARILPGAPWLLWMFWGAVFGGALGYWLVAPSYGQRENRAYILLLPLFGMMLVGAFTWAFVT